MYEICVTWVAVVYDDSHFFIVEANRDRVNFIFCKNMAYTVSQKNMPL